MIIQTELGMVNTETGEVVSKEFASNEWYEDREIVNTSTSYDINVTEIRYSSKYKNIFLMHDKLNHRIFSKEYYKKHKVRILANKKIIYDKDPKKWVDISKDYYYNKGGNTKTKCECGKSVTKYGLPQHRRMKIHKTNMEKIENKKNKDNQTENLFKNLDIDKIKMEKIEIVILKKAKKEKKIKVVKPRGKVGRPRKTEEGYKQHKTPELYQRDKDKLKKRVLDNYHNKGGREKQLKKVTCACKSVVSKCNYTVHLKSKIHKKRLLDIN